jgi:hypothetical protein
MPQRRSLLPTWNITVVTSTKSSNQYGAVRDALLYADRVHWMSVESLGLFTLGDGIPKDITLRARKAAFEAFMQEIAASGARDLIIQHFDQDFATMFSFENAFEKTTGFSIGGSSAVNRFIAPEMDQVLSDSRVLMFDILPDSTPEHWDVYRAAGELTGAISRLLLQDVSSLPLDAIMDVREHMSDSLNPMRGELLRFTEHLRTMVCNNVHPIRLRREAENLVATKIEPVMREADRHAKELLDKKWRKFLTGAAKAFGLVGASFVDPKLLGKAIQQCLETSASAFAAPEDKTPFPKETAHFVLKARSYIVARGY